MVKKEKLKKEKEIFSNEAELEELKQEFLRDDEGFSWYILNVLTTQETVVKDRLERFVLENSLENDIIKVLVPEVTYFEVISGIKEEKRRKLYPGYILVKMRTIEPAQEESHLSLWYQIRNVNGIIDFLGMKEGKIPIPVDSDELMKIFKAKEVSKTKKVYNFNIGNKVKIIDGAFKEFIGEISEVDEDKMQVKVLLPVFGQQVDVQISFDEVEKI